MRETVSVIIILIVFSQFLNGQSITQSPETDARPEPMQEVFDLHFPDHHLKKIHGRLYSYTLEGQYVQNPNSNRNTRITQHQFFKSRTPVDGIIFTLYDTIHCAYILYDLYRDKLIVWEPSTWAFIELEEEFIMRFMLFEKDVNIMYEFINTEPENDTMGIRRAGIYQVLFEGEWLHLYKKHFKSLTETTEMGQYVNQFIKKERLVLRKGNDYFRIERNRNLLKIYPEVKDDIKRFLRSSRINIKYASDEQIQILGQFVDELGLQPEIQDPG